MQLTRGISTLSILAAAASLSGGGCGKTRDRTYEAGDEIVGGVLTQRETMVRISMYTPSDVADIANGGDREPSSICSGRRIARGVVLTAAHCVYGYTMVDLSFPNLTDNNGDVLTFEDVTKGAVAPGYAGDHTDAKDVAVLLYDEDPELEYANIRLAQPQWGPAGGIGYAYGRNNNDGDDDADDDEEENEFYCSPDIYYTHAQQPLTIIASTTDPPPAMAGDPVDAPALHPGDSGGPLAVWRGGLQYTIAVNSAQDFVCVDGDGNPVPARKKRTFDTVKRLNQTAAPAPGRFVALTGRGYWAGFDRQMLTWLGGFVAAAANNNGAWPAQYDLQSVAKRWYSWNNANHCVFRNNGIENEPGCDADNAVFDNKYPVCLDAMDNKINYNLDNDPPIASHKIREYIPGMANVCERGSNACTDTVDSRDTDCTKYCEAIAKWSNAVVFQSSCGPRAPLRTCDGAGPTDYVAECKCQIIPLGPQPGGGGTALTGSYPYYPYPDGGMPGYDASIPGYDAGIPGYDAGVPGDAPTSTPIDRSGNPSWATNLPPTPGCSSPDVNNDCWLHKNNASTVEVRVAPIITPSSWSPQYDPSEPDSLPGPDVGP